MFPVSASRERRRFHRIVYNAPALLSKSGRSWIVQLLDISLHGCLLKAPLDWTGEPGMEYGLTVELGDSLEIRMNLVLVRSAEQRIGFRCGHIDLDSACELRRLVELNLGDSSLLERDLNALMAT